MTKLLIACAAAALLAGPATAQSRYEERAHDVQRALPSSAEVEAMAPALDRMVGALLSVDVGPILDAADPYARRPGYGARGRTLGALGHRNDPGFERRLRGSIYGSTARMGRMMDSLAAATPAFARAMAEMEAGIGAAIDQYRDPRPLPRDEWYDDDDDYWGGPDE